MSAAPNLQAGTLLVPSQYPTIQSAIDASNSHFGTVIVSPGVYNENINFNGKNITVRSTNPEDGATILSTRISGGTGVGPVVTFENGEYSARLEGFYIAGGYGKVDDFLPAGGGVYCKNSSPIIRRNIFYHNLPALGGGAYFSGSGPIGVPLFDRNIVLTNDASHSGGGIKIVHGSRVHVRNNLIVGNRTFTQGGGGIDVFDCPSDSAPAIYNNVIVGNLANNKGSAISCSDASPLIFNNIITLNRGANGPAIFHDGKSSAYVCHNNTWSNMPSDYGANINVCGAGEISSDPMFINPGEWNDFLNTPGNPYDDMFTYSSEWIDGDYDLLPNSPCVDAGDTTWNWNPQQSSWNTTDFNGGPRFWNDFCAADTGLGGPPVIDIGAYEFLASGNSFAEYIGPKAGSWFVPAHWSGNSVPDCATAVAVAESVVIDGPRAIALSVGVQSGGGGIDLLEGADLHAGSLGVGYGIHEPGGIFRQFGGTVNVEGELGVAVDTLHGIPQAGIFELHGGELSTKRIRIGWGSKSDGLFKQFGGQCDVSDRLTIGGQNYWGIGGRYELLGGSLNVHDIVLGGSYSELGSFNGEGILVVEGATLTNTGFIHIGGNESYGLLEIRNGGTVSAPDGISAPDGEGRGNILIDGNQSTLMTGGLAIGIAPIFPFGKVDVQNGASLLCDGLQLGMECFPTTGTWKASITIDGAGSSLTSTSSVIVGGVPASTTHVNGTPPTLAILNGAAFSATELKVLPFGHLFTSQAVLDADLIFAAGSQNPSFDAPLSPNTTESASGVGVLDIGGSLSMTAEWKAFCNQELPQPVSGTLLIEIAGTQPGTEHDVMNISQELFGGGKIKIEFVNGYFPPLGTQFTVGSYGQLVAPFSLYEPPAFPDDRFLRLSYESNPVAGVGGNIVATVISTDDLLSFADPQGVALGSAPSDIVTAEFDGANGIDVALTVPAANPNDPGAVFILLNQGVDGNGEWLGYQIESQIIVGANPLSIAAGDFDGVNGMDLVTANNGSDTLSVLTNDGAAGFTRSDLAAGAANLQVMAVGAGDMAGDKRDDIVFADAGFIDAQGVTPGVVTLLESTDSGFIAKASEPVGVTPIVVDPADVDNDRDMDVAVLTTQAVTLQTGIIEVPNVAVLIHSDVSPGFSPPTFYPVNGEPVSLALGDLDNDGFVDIVASNAAINSAAYLRNNGNQTFQGAAYATFDGKPLSISAADLDGDGDVDLVAVVETETGKELQLVPNRLDGTQQLAFGEPIPQDPDGEPVLVVTPDVDDDGSPDIFAVTEAPNDGIAGGFMFAANVLVNALELSKCVADIAPPGGNGVVNVDDLLLVINTWGPCASPCPADIAPAGGNGTVNVDDLLMVINGWGQCPQ